ncbi:MAG: response regulator [Bdellovibrionia bacterium]
MGKTILLIEDDKAIREALSLVLENEGYSVSVVTNGREGIDWLKASQVLPDLILLDLMMPDMDGIEFRKAQVKNQKLASVPVIMLTASPGLAKDLSDVSEFAFTILSKPLVIETLVEAIESCIGGLADGKPGTSFTSQSDSLEASGNSSGV